LSSTQSVTSQHPADPHVVPMAMIFQMGTNNWQRMKKNGSELEFAPGSGVLHEAHHNAYNKLAGVKSYSMYPSKNQGQPTGTSDYRVFELDHDIPICESASPNSSKRWHAFSDEEFATYLKRMEHEVYDYMKECEAKEGKHFTMCIGHHAFVNPLVLRNVIRRRVSEGLPKCPLYCFVHGTALKMYRWEIGGTSPNEFPMRFHKMILEERLFEDIEDGVNACFVISLDNLAGFAELFPKFPQTRVIVSPNGINVEKFRPRDKTLTNVVTEQLVEGAILWPATPPSKEECAKFTQCVSFAGKAAEWKRQMSLLHAAAVYEKEFPQCVTLCVGIGPDDEIQKLKDLCAKLELKNTYLLGARSQDVLAEMFTVSDVGCFPSFREPFGMVFVECMGCRCPVIGADSGGPKDFVTPDVGELVLEPPETKDLPTVMAGMETLGKTLNDAITRCLKEDWKKSKADACYRLVQDKFTVGVQVTNMLTAVQRLPGPAVDHSKDRKRSSIPIADNYLMDNCVLDETAQVTAVAN